MINISEEKEKMGGRAYKNGLRLMNENYSVKVYYEEDERLRYRLSKVKYNEYFKHIKKLPVIRGIVSIILAIFSFLKEGIKKPRFYLLIALIIALDLTYVFFASGNGSGGGYIIYLYLLIPLVLLFFFRGTVSEVLQYHGAEHKAVNYYENDYKGDIDSYSRLHRRCGSNIIFYYFLLSFGLGWLVSEAGLLLFISFEFLCLGLAYEAVRYTPEKLLFIPQIFQRVVTREPEEKHLAAAEKALEILERRGSKP